MPRQIYKLSFVGVLVLVCCITAVAEDGGKSDTSKTHENVIYGMHGGLALLMDVYEPAESNGHALLYIAGSGWHWPTDYGAGGIKDAVATGVLGGGSHRVFADAGFTVFVINHRQAPLSRYPAAVEDARRAVRFIRHHGDKYGVTDDAIAAFGISSGAHLVLMLALEDGTGDPVADDEVQRHSSKVDVVAAYAGPTDLTAEDWAKSIGATFVASFVGAPLGGFAGGAHAEASPITHVDADDPPVLLLHGEVDRVVPVSQARSLAARLREHQVEVKYVEIAGGRHDLKKIVNHDPSELPSFPAMARWLREHLPAQDLQDESFISIPGAQSRVYKRVGDTQLRLHVFNPPGVSDQARPAIVYFFGGGWIGGSVTQLAPRCEYFCARGMVAVAAGYRVKSRHQVGAFECVADAKSAIRWLRAHAAELGIDENRIVAAGGSSGGHLAASTALIDGFDELNEDLAVSSVPNALVLHSPALDLPSIFGAMDRENAVAQFGEWVTRCEPVSPLTHVRPDAPPTIIFHGTADASVPHEHSQRFAKAMRAQGNRCELVAYDGRSHGFSLLEAGDGSDFSDTLRRTDEFLISLDYLTGKPTADVFTSAKQVDRFFDSDGVRIRYVDVGPRGGEPIVLVAGFSQSIEQAWGTTGVIDALDEDHRVIALDLRGHGKSDKPHETSAYGNAMVADIVRLLDHLKIYKAHIVGYSMGGRIVAKLVADHPERVKTAMPSATSIEPPDEEGTSFVERMAKSLETSGSIRPALEHLTTDGSMTEEEIEQIVAMVRDTNDTKALAAVMRGIDDLLPDRTKLEANRVPCMSIIGEHDPNLMITRKTAQYMANLELHIIEGANHMTAFRSPAFVAAIRSFIAKHPSSTHSE